MSQQKEGVLLVAHIDPSGLVCKSTFALPKKMKVMPNCWDSLKLNVCIKLDESLWIRFFWCGHAQGRKTGFYFTTVSLTGLDFVPD